MIPKEKADSLINKIKQHTDCAGDAASIFEAQKIQLTHAKKVAVIVVEEIISELPMYQTRYKFWNDVRKELTNLT